MGCDLTDLRLEMKKLRYVCMLTTTVCYFRFLVALSIVFHCTERCQNGRSTGIGLGLHWVGVGKTEPLRTEVIPTYAKQGSTGIPIGRSCLQMNIFYGTFSQQVDICQKLKLILGVNFTPPTLIA